jgi:hypothetical protein
VYIYIYIDIIIVLVATQAQAGLYPGALLGEVWNETKRQWPEPQESFENIPASKKVEQTKSQWPFQDPKLEVPTIYKAYIRPM